MDFFFQSNKMARLPQKMRRPDWSPFLATSHLYFISGSVAEMPFNDLEFVCTLHRPYVRIHAKRSEFCASAGNMRVPYFTASYSPNLPSCSRTYMPPMTAHASSFGVMPKPFKFVTFQVDIITDGAPAVLAAPMAGDLGAA